MSSEPPTAAPHPAPDVALDAAFEAALAYSHYAQRIGRRYPSLIERVRQAPLARPPLAAWREALFAERMNADQIDHLLREQRRELMLRTLVRDLAGNAPFDELVGDLSAYAELALQAATRAHSLELFGSAEPPCGFSVVAMGKLGAQELNASSDIDIIFLCDGDDDSHRDALNKLARRVSRSLDHEIDGEFVFRVDTRLRPYGDAGPLVPTLGFLEHYLITQGRMWERLAWLKARVVCGPLDRALQSLITPFVYRKYLDFDAVASMRELHGTLRAEKNDPNNLKLGRGGIRELEFGVQLRQLVRAGRDPSIRVRKTLPALDALARAHRISAAQARELGAHYLLLRRIEHVLQYREDQQTQTLPRSEDGLRELAQALGFDSLATFQQTLERTRQASAEFFDGTLSGVFGVSDDTAAYIQQVLGKPQPAATRPVTELAAPEALAAAGYAAPEDTSAYIQTTLASSRLRSLPETSRQRFHQLTGACIDHAARTPHPDAACKRTLELLLAIASRSSYLALMVERPQVLDRVVDLAATSEWAVRYVAQHPLLLDELMDGRTLSIPVDYRQWRADLQASFAEAGDDAERAIDGIRHVQQNETFRLLLKDIAGLLPLETLSDHLSALADVVIDVTLAHLIREARLPPRARLAVIAYGRWGGKELGYASDLDLIFLLPDDALEHREALTRVAQKLQSWITTLTAAGRAYDIDVRLRPDGAAGLLLSTLSGFADYQRHKAWTWEHQALTRARFAAGDVHTGKLFEQIRDQIIARPRDWPTLRQEILDMRQKVAEGHPNRRPSEVFDLKHDRGGLVDMEFAIQALVLRHGPRHQTLRANHGNIALAKRAGGLGLIPAPLAAAAADAYRNLRTQQHAFRLQGMEHAQAPIEQFQPEREAIRQFYETVFQA